MPTVVQFVASIPDSVEPNPAVLLDLTASPWSVVAEGTDFSPPPLRRAIIDAGVLRDGSEIPASAYDNRVVTLSLLVNAASQNALATQLQALNRELNRARNLLKYQPDGASNPVFFRTFRSPDYTLDINRGTAGENNARLIVPIIAEPFAYGQRVDIQAVTVNNNPAAATNPMFWEVTGVIGDVPTPLYLFSESDLGSQKTVLAVRRHGVPADTISSRQCESFSATGGDTSNPGGGPDAAMSGAGTNNFMRTTFATSQGLGPRLTGSLADATAGDPTPNAAYLGIYRVFLRARKSVAGDVVTVKQLFGGFHGEVVTLPLIAGPFWVDLGLIQFPPGSRARFEGYTGREWAPSLVDYRLYAGRSSGSGNLDWDALLFVPADEELVIVKWENPSNTMDSIWDGPNDVAYPRHETLSRLLIGDDAASGFTEISGKIPLLAPNQTNRIFFMESVDAADLITRSSSMTVSYWPRWLYIRP